MRAHQKKLIAVKEEARHKKDSKKLKRDAMSETPLRRSKSPGKRKKKPVDMSRFAQLIKHWENYGATQRDIPPEIKRVVRKLTCQTHKYMYCPSCKEYEEEEMDPMDNIKKFMQFANK